jgi:hypothetical protein
MSSKCIEAKSPRPLTRVEVEEWHAALLGAELAAVGAQAAREIFDFDKWLLEELAS